MQGLNYDNLKLPTSHNKYYYFRWSKEEIT